MEDEDRIRMGWMSGQFEKAKMTCEVCGDKNAWDKTHMCCEDQCNETLNALQSFPFAAWDDISAATLDPSKVLEARKLEIQYAERKPCGRRSPGGRRKEKDGGSSDPDGLM